MKPLHAFALLLISAAAATAQTNTYPWPASGNVGIGTINPTSKLQLEKTASDAVSLANSFFFFADTPLGAGLLGQQKLTSPYAFVLQAQNQTNNAFFPISLNPSGGNVGVGTTNPVSKFHVVAGTNQAIATYIPSVASGIPDFAVGGIGFQLSRPGDGAFAHAIYTYDSTGGAKDNLAISSRSDIVFTAGNSGPGGAPERMRIAETGNVGIGTVSPSEKLTVTNNATNAITIGVRGAYPVVSATGTNYYKQAEIGEPVYNIPAGVVDSGYRIGLAVQGYTYTNDFAGTLGTQMSLWVRAGSNTGAPTGTITNSYGIYLENLDGGVNVVNKYGLFQSNPTAKNYFAGNVGIGTTSPTEKLSVNGRIRAKEVIVETTNWSDYVFAKDYKLASLSEVEQHIRQQGHLPGVPSATEVAEKGVSVGDMQAVLLAKIEELTLHQIAQEKELARLRENEKILCENAAALRAEVQQLRQSK
jgi:hypothetical protein